MLEFLIWYLLVTLVGLISFPVVFLIFRALPERGYAFSRAFGWMAWGYVFWLLASLGVVRNDTGGLLLALSLLAAAAWFALRKFQGEELASWWREHGGYVLACELLFLAAFGAWAFVRAANPEIFGTEKPMEMAFINAILRSPEFPPHDPWLAGYGISYYYFGYVLVAMLAKVAGTAGPVAFNLGLALVFGLSALGAYGVVYNLLQARQRVEGRLRASTSVFGALLGPLFLLVVSNWEGFFHSLWQRGLFWQRAADGSWQSRFWTWLDIKDLNLPPEEPLSWIPQGHWWWWRASRVLQDYDLAGGWREIIDEFPFFSYLLGDLHPHVLAMPFALLCVALALNIYLGGGLGWMRSRWMEINLSLPEFLVAAVVLGGMSFLNTWDFPIYVGLFSAALVLGKLRRESAADCEAGRNPLGGAVGEFIKTGLLLGIAGILLYLPFYIGFSSQAGGILPNLVYPTRGAHLWMMFGPLLVILLVYLGREFLQQRRASKRWGVGAGLGLVAVLFALALLVGWLIAKIPQVGQSFLGSLGAEGQEAALWTEAFLRRLRAPGGWITLVGLLGLSLAVLHGKIQRRTPQRLAGNGFLLLLVTLGALLVLVPEFFFLRDQFGWRMNTIFKFYYQAWLLWSLAAAYAAVVLLSEVKAVWRAGLAALFVAVIGMGLVYPSLSLWNKTNGFSPQNGFTLDGSQYLQRQDSAEMAAIEWLRQAPAGVLVEAVGESYRSHARVSTYSGQPGLLGWPGHESQWRGGSEEMGSRRQDIETIYTSNSWEEVQALLEQYEVRYIFVGNLERSTYPVREANLMRFLRPGFEQGNVVIYQVP